MTPERPDMPERDPALDAAWKAHSTEVPPSRVDAAILAAAHREVKARPHVAGDDDARAPARVWWGLAAAATIGAIAFGVVQMAPPPLPETPSVASDMPSGSTPTEPAQAPEKMRESLAAPSVVAPAANDVRQRQEAKPEPRARPPARAKSAERDAPPAPSVPATPPAPRPFPAEPAAKLEAADSQRGLARPDAERANAGTREIPPPAASAPQAAAPGVGALRRDEAGRGVELRKQRTASAMADRPAPADWIEKIVALFNAGSRDEAARELRAFREAYPDADTRLPESLRAWAATVKRDESAK